MYRDSRAEDGILQALSIKPEGGGLAVSGIQIIAVDVDGDGDIDLVAPGKSRFFIFEQIDFPRQKAPWMSG
jgi:hypothetical protein